VAIQVRLVDDQDVRDLQDARFDHLDTIAQVWRQDHDRRVGHSRDFQLGLTDADRLEDDLVEAKGSQQPDRLARGERQATEMSACAHAADEDFRVQRVALHADPIAEDRAAREGRVGVGREHGDRAFPLSQQRQHAVDQRRLARPRRAREAGHARGAILFPEGLFQ
jgi:hypothetical protein